MTQKIYNVTDLGPGDGGKGGVVHGICCKTDAHVVIKFGGNQGQHGVHNSAGMRYAFSLWGCGTLEGIKTHVSPLMVVSPIGILNEAQELRYQCGIHNPFDLLTVDERALCATPYHGIASRLKELARGNNPRGTIGTGIGESYRDWQRLPELAIQAGDLSRLDLKDRLAAVRAQVRLDLSDIIGGEFLPADREVAGEEIALLESDAFLDHIVEQFREASRRTKVVDPDYLRREILSKDGVAVAESSHGILTDHFHGFYPHVSAIRTLPSFRKEMFRDAGFTGQIVNLGVTRAYAIRHGAGPMPTDDPAMYESLLQGSHKGQNRYQGKARVGPIDWVLLRYAIEVCGGPTAFDGLAITWFDQMRTNGVWRVCDSYQNASDENYFLPEGGLKVRRGEDEEQILFQEKLGKQLMSCVPNITDHEIQPNIGTEDLFQLCAEEAHAKLGVPVRMVSFGPTERDKFYK